MINIALFDIYSVLMTRYSEQFVAQHTEEFHQRFYLLLHNSDFQASITNSTNGLRQVTERFEAIKNIHADLPADIEVA